MQAGFVADKSLGYAQSAAVDAATAVNTLTFGSAGAAGLPAGMHTLLVTPQTQAVRWRDDGTDPTATVGYPLAVGAELRYTNVNAKNLKFISQTAGAIINVVALGTGSP